MNTRVNPWLPFPDESSIILGQVGGQSEAHLGKRDDLIELRYRSKEEQIKEVTYLKLLADYDGIPKLYYDNIIPKTRYVPHERRYVEIEEHEVPFNKRPLNYVPQYYSVAVVQRLYPIDGEISKEHIIDICSQLVRLLQLLYDYNIVNPHISGFIMQYNFKAYITDCRLWEWFSVNGVEKTELLRSSLLQVVQFLRDHTSNASVLLSIKRIENFLTNALRVDRNTIKQIESMLRGDTHSYIID